MTIQKLLGISTYALIAGAAGIGAGYKTVDFRLAQMEQAAKDIPQMKKDMEHLRQQTEQNTWINRKILEKVAPEAASMLPPPAMEPPPGAPPTEVPR